jgi:hypothetical protein
MRSDSLLLPSSPLGRSFFSLSSSTSSQPWLLQIIETWELVPLLPILYPYYKSAQITQQLELDVGYYSPEARTSINHVHPHLCNRPRPYTQADTNLLPAVENPDTS